MTLTVPPTTLPADARRQRRAASGPWWPCLPPALLLAVLGGALVRQRRGLWYDELYTAEVGTAGLPALVRALWTGTGTTSYLADVPPSYNAPYYLVVHLWLSLTRLPADELGLRMLSLLAAIGAVVVLVRTVQRLAGAPVALAAGLLAASSPLVVEYSAEGRMYGLALLAVATTALGLARWLDAAPRALLLLGVGGAASGLMHWFALPVVAGLVLAALLLRRRAGLPVAAVGALAAVPCLALVGLSRLNGTGTSAAGWIRDSESPVPVLALQAWSGGHAALLALLLVALVAGVTSAARRPQARPLAVVATCWTAVPLALVQLAELVRPVFAPRYLLPALLGVALLAGLGTASWRRAAAVPATALLVAASLLAALPLLERGSREDGRGAVAALAQRHVPGEVVVAVDRRAALALEHYGGPRVLSDLRVPPADPPPGAEVVWLLRQSTGERVRPSDDDDLLRADGLSVVEQRVFGGTSSDLVLQRWER